MAEWFKAKVRFLEQAENGLIKKTTEQVLIDALSFTEAEARILGLYEWKAKELHTAAISRTNISEVVFYGDSGNWHKCKVTYIVTDPDTDREKKVTTYIVVESDNVLDAWDRVHEHLKEMLVPFQVPKIEEFPIVDVLEYEKPSVKLEKVAQ